MNMRTPQQVAAILEALEKEYPLAECTLEETDPWKLLVQVRLAAQCTDARVNMVTPALFEKYPDCFAMAKAEVEDVERYIHSCGFYHGKARDIVAQAQRLVNVYGGRVPDTMEDLLTLPGVGRKSANLILGDVYNIPGSTVVDTHCIRLSNRMGFIDSDDPVKVEFALKKVVAPEESNDFCHRLVLHGRAVCTARKAMCEACCLQQLCRTGKKTLPKPPKAGA
jgi:endonuclease-3